MRLDLSLFHGLSAFPITPAHEQGRVDSGALITLLQRLVAAEVDSIGLLGSTGTYADLTRSQRRHSVEAAVECSGGRVPIIVGIGALRTSGAQAAGVDGLLLVPVSYTPIYNNPSTTHFAFSDELIALLSAVPPVVAVKNPAPRLESLPKVLGEDYDQMRSSEIDGYLGNPVK